MKDNVFKPRKRKEGWTVYDPTGEFIQQKQNTIKYSTRRKAQKVCDYINELFNVGRNKLIEN